MSKSAPALRKNGIYQVGEKVNFIITVNATAGMHLGDRVTGTIVNAFEAASLRIYRVELDTEPKTVVGNVLAYEIRPLI